jgi:hypothetical protein
MENFVSFLEKKLDIPAERNKIKNEILDARKVCMSNDQIIAKVNAKVDAYIINYTKRVSDACSRCFIQEENLEICSKCFRMSLNQPDYNFIKKEYFLRLKQTAYDNELEYRRLLNKLTLFDREYFTYTARFKRILYVSSINFHNYLFFRTYDG